MRQFHLFTLALGTLSLATLTGCRSNQGPTPPAAPQPLVAADTPAAARKWRLTFREEFDGKTLDPKVWHVDKGESNNEIEFVPEKMRLDGEGRLEFAVTRNGAGKFERAGDWIWTKSGFSQRFGYFECRARFRQKPGFNAGFWLYPVSKNAVNPFAARVRRVFFLTPVVSLRSTTGYWL